MAENVFTPGGAAGNTVEIAATAASAAVALPTAEAAYPEIEVTNADSLNTVFVLLGSSASMTVAAPAGATPGGYPILPGQSKVISRNGATHAAAICDAGLTAQVYFSAGRGY